MQPARTDYLPEKLKYDGLIRSVKTGINHSLTFTGHFFVMIGIVYWLGNQSVGDFAEMWPWAVIMIGVFTPVFAIIGFFRQVSLKSAHQIPVAMIGFSLCVVWVSGCIIVINLALMAFAK